MPVLVKTNLCAWAKVFQPAHVSQSCGPCRVPLQYLTNCCHWRDMVLAVGPGVLIPRPETELLIDFAQQVSHATHHILCPLQVSHCPELVATMLIVIALKKTQSHNAVGLAKEARLGCRPVAGPGHRQWSYCIRACQHFTQSHSGTLCLLSSLCAIARCPHHMSHKVQHASDATQCTSCQGVKSVTDTLGSVALGVCLGCSH